MKRLFPLLGVLLVLNLGSANVWALGTEEFGNKPLFEANYVDWPGIMPVVNCPARVYSNWVNGNEHMYYKGATSILNATLKDFAVVKADERRVVLRPGPGEAHTFDGKKIACNWNLHLLGGIAGHMATLDKGELIWSKSPILTIYVGGDIDLKDLEIPDGATLTSLADLKKRCTEALTTSTDKTVRGWGCGQLARLDRFDERILNVVAGRLKDEDDWVRLNAAGALAVFGAKARTALDPLRDAAKSEDKGLKQTAEKTIATVEAANEQPEEERQFGAVMAQIDKFLAAHRKKPK